MGKGILAAFLAAVAMFGWGALSHMVLHLQPEEGFKNGAAVAEVMRSSDDEDGVYFVPLMPDEETAPAAHEDWVKQFKRGPRAVVIYDAGEVDVDRFMGTTFLMGFLVMFVSCLLAAVMLRNAGIAHFMGRLLYCVLLGAIITIFSQGSQWAWFGAPLGWTLPAMINDVVAWACAGVVLGAMIKPK